MANERTKCPLTDDQIKHMVNRFLAWKLPEDFTPDAGISFKPILRDGGPWPEAWPVGTNLLMASQAEAMIRYMVDGIQHGGVCLWCGFSTTKGSLDELADAIYAHLGECHASPVPALQSAIRASEAREREMQGKYQFMVDRAADEKLDGYREIGARAAQAENALDAHKAFHFAVGKAMGMMFEADGRADEPAPMAELVDAIKRLKSELDAALAQVEELKKECAFLKHHRNVEDLAALVGRLAHLLRKYDAENDCIRQALDYLSRHGLNGSPLRYTSATSQQFVEKVRREALEEAAERALQTDYSLYSGPRQDALLRAAILGEKEE